MARIVGRVLWPRALPRRIDADRRIVEARIADRRACDLAVGVAGDFDLQRIAVGAHPQRRFAGMRPHPSESTLWVGADGYPLKIEVTGDANGQVARTSIRYSRFNDPAIRIDPPR